MWFVMVEQCVTFVLRYYHSPAISVLPCRNKNTNCDAIESEIGQHCDINEEMVVVAVVVVMMVMV